MDPISPLREFKHKLFHLHAKDMTVHPERLNEVGIFAFPKGMAHAAHPRAGRHQLGTVHGGAL